MAKLIIIRGLPGSGKTTLAKKMADESRLFHVETDMFFVHLNGEYKFDPTQIGRAHDWCQREAAKALEAGHDVVVSNTFTQKWEILPYLRMAQSLNADFIVLKCTGTWDNVHNVPVQSLEKMKARWEDWHGELHGN
jgi:predicted kinase